VARQTRAQRRARRQAAAGAEPKQQQQQQRRGRPQQVRPAAQQSNLQTGRRQPRDRGRFVKESWGELQKVEWPSRSQVVQGTIVVLIACAIVGAYLWGVDQGFKPLVRNVILGQ
jgi:preprotein translocase SecE subunit